MGLEVFKIKDLHLQCGQVLPEARVAWQSYGTLSADKDNVVVLPTFYTGTHLRNEGFFGHDRAINPLKHFIISINMFGNGLSSSPSNTPAPFAGPDFPDISLWDNVYCQRLLLREQFGIEQIRLVTGWSMAGCQAYQWAAQYPDAVHAIAPFCASARTSPHNIVFLEGVKAALQADQNYNNGHYSEQPVAGLKAFARVYAGWAFSQTFYRQHLYRELGFENFEQLLADWETDHAQNWDANDLLAKLHCWQRGDISANRLYENRFEDALAAIKAKAILIPCTQDLYFPPQDNELEVQHMPNAQLRPYDSPWGHCVASPGNDPAFHRFLDDCLNELLAL